MSHADEKDFESKVAYARMQHLALHKALPIKARCVDEVFHFENGDNMPSNLYRGDAYVDRLLEHYMQNEKCLSASDLKCICPSHFDTLKKEINCGNTYRKAPSQSLRRRLLKAVEQTSELS